MRASHCLLYSCSSYWPLPHSLFFLLLLPLPPPPSRAPRAVSRRRKTSHACSEHVTPAGWLGWPLNDREPPSHPEFVSKMHHCLLAKALSKYAYLFLGFRDPLLSLSFTVSLILAHTPYILQSHSQYFFYNKCNYTYKYIHTYMWVYV